MEDTRAYCVEGCGELAVAERFEDFVGEDERVDLICQDCFDNSNPFSTRWVGADRL